MYQKKDYNYYFIDDYLNILFSKHNIDDIFQNKHKYYNIFYIYKKNGNKRKIEQPLGELMLIQKNISKILLNYRRNYDSSHGFEKHRSIYTNALNHTNKETVLNIDLKDFFLNISENQVLSALKKIEQITEKNVKKIADIVTINNHLPQGSPTSPIISNFICDELDYNLSLYCKNNNITYSRYADDLTFSYDKKKIEKSDYIPIFNIIKEHGFIINYKKFRYFHRNARQTVTGLTVNEKVNVSRKFHKQLRAILYNWKTKGNKYTQTEIFKINKNKTHFALFIKSYITFYGFIKGRDNINYLNFVRDFNEIVSSNDDLIVRNIGVIKVKYTENTNIIEDFDFDGLPEFWDFPSRYNENRKPVISEEVIEAGKNELKDLEDKLNRKPDFEDFINSFIESFGKERVRNTFNNLSHLANKLGLDTSIANDYYDRTFNIKQLVLDEIKQYEDSETPTPQQIEIQERENTRIGMQADPVDISVNTTTGEVQARTVEIEDTYDETEIGELESFKINTPEPKMAFNPTSQKGPDGTWKVDLNALHSTVLGEDGLLVLDADYMHQVVNDSIENPGSVYMEFTEDPEILDAIEASSKGFKERLAKAKTKEEKAMITPIIILHRTIDKDGDPLVRPISFVHSDGWYTDENTADTATKITGNANVRQLRLNLANTPNGRQAIQIFNPRGINYNSYNKTGNKELLPVSSRNSQATVGYARFYNGKFSYSNAPEGLDISIENASAEVRARIKNIEQFEKSAYKFNRNNPVIFHKVGVNSSGQNVYMINTLLSPYTYDATKMEEVNLSNFTLPEDLKTTFEKALLGILLKNKDIAPELKRAIDNLMPIHEQQDEKIQSLSTINMLSKFIRVFQDGDKNSSTDFKKTLREYKEKGKKGTVFRQFKDPKTKFTDSEMAFWDNSRNDYRIVNLKTFTTGTLSDIENGIYKQPTSNYEELLNKMVQAMSVVNIYATDPTSKTNLITKDGIKTVSTESIYKDLLMTPLVSYKMKNAKGEDIEVFNIQPVIHFMPIESNGNIKEISEQSSKTTLEKAREASEEAKNELDDNNKVKDEIQKVLDKKDEFIKLMVQQGYSEEKALELLNARIRRMSSETIRDFKSRNNVDIVEILGDRNTSKIKGITIEEQKQL
ncbi:reverse transcriptase family protein [Riemerella anatipestifer]|nr:reverse transcriptase family protein [Riemerella anatipestifer]